MLIFYLSGHSIIKIKPKYFRLSGAFIWGVISIGIPTAIIQICLSVATSLTNIAVAGVYILLAKPLISLFNHNPIVIEFGKWLLISQVTLYPAFGRCYMMTITYQTIGSSKMGLFLSLIRQGIFYVPFIMLLPKLLGVTGIYFSQPATDVLTIIICLIFIKPIKKMASENMLHNVKGPHL